MVFISAKNSIVLMDELDLLLTKNQKVIYNFFDWPNKPNSRLIVLAIANTMDLPERTLSNKVASRLEMKRITFQPYTYQQLITIVESRLASFNIFSADAIMLCARKVSSISGDARRALAICRRAIELLEDSSLTLKEKEKTITLDHIQKVITDMYSGPGVQAVRKASLHQKIFLVSIFRVARVTGKQEVEFGDVCSEHERICGLKGMAFKPTNRDLVAVASFMSSFHLIHCETNKMGDPYQKMRLLISEDDMSMALKQDVENEFLVKIIQG
jgi:Cdc6-like AAA superfamily ATPase